MKSPLALRSLLRLPLLFELFVHVNNAARGDAPVAAQAFGRRKLAC